MSIETKDIKEKIAQDILLAKMPAHFRKACIDAYKTNVLEIRDRLLCDTDLITYIIPFLNANTNIHSVKMVNASIKSIGAEALANTHLQTINLNYNRIKNSGARALAKSTSLRTLYVMDNGIGEDGAQALSECKYLRNLDISWNSIGDKAAQSFAQKINLQALKAVYCEIGNAGIQALVQSKSLYILDVRSNRFDGYDNAEMQSVLHTLLSDNNQKLTMLFGVSLTSEIEKMLQTNREYQIQDTEFALKIQASNQTNPVTFRFESLLSPSLENTSAASTGCRL